MLHAPLPKRWRGMSLLEMLKLESKEERFPEHFHFDATINKHWPPVYLAPRFPTRSPLLLKTLKGAKVFGDGSLVVGKKLHSWSATYQLTSPARLINVSASASRVKTDDYLEKAVLISRGAIAEGTFGDYVIEFLLPLARVARDMGNAPILLDSGFSRQFAPQDLKRLGLRHHDVPAGGLNVGKLTVVGPCQPWDNFRKENVEKLRALLPVESLPGTDKIYLSRLGIGQTPANKQARNVINESEVESMLEAKGFLVIRTHLFSNEALRGHVARASLIVAPHGAAMTHLAWSSPRAVVELAHEQWWVPCYAKLCHAIGVRNYHVLCTDRGRIDIDRLARTVSSLE